MINRQTLFALLSIVVTLLVTLSACDSNDRLTVTDVSPDVSVPLQTVPNAPDAYPYPAPTDLVVDDGYPGPQFITPPAIPNPSSGNLIDGPLDIPTPSPGFGIVHGTVIAASKSSKIYLTGDIYLAPVIYSDGSVSVPFLRLDTQNDPKADLRNTNGDFAFLDVPPGEYGIIIHGLVSDYIVPDHNEFLIIEVKSDETLDLGVIEIE